MRMRPPMTATPLPAGGRHAWRRQGDRYRPLVRGLRELAGQLQGLHRPGHRGPGHGELYRLAFPELSIEDGARAAVEVVHALGIAELACVIGNSMGGMTALAVLLLHPGIARSHQHFRQRAGAALLHCDPLVAA